MIKKVTREEAIDYLKWVRPKKPYTQDKKNVQTAIDMAIEALNERPHGTWRMAKGRVEKAICEHCGMLSIVEPFGKPPYCQWCGAKMKEGDAE